MHSAQAHTVPADVFFCTSGFVCTHTARLRLSGDGAHYVWRGGGGVRVSGSVSGTERYDSQRSLHKLVFLFFCMGGAVNNGPGCFDWVAQAHVNQPRRFSDEGDISGCETDERSRWLAHWQAWPFIQLVVRGDANSHSCMVIFSLFFKDPLALHTHFSVCLFCQSDMPRRSHKQKQHRRKGSVWFLLAFLWHSNCFFHLT